MQHYNANTVHKESYPGRSELGYNIELGPVYMEWGTPVYIVGLVSFVFTRTQNKRNLPHWTGVPHSM